MANPDNYLLPLEDGLMKRTSQGYARDKLYAVTAYVTMARVSMNPKGWYAFNYIDLQAGPGKNQIGSDILLGSPLIALKINPPFDHYWFNELGQEEHGALQERISVSPYKDRVHLQQADVNVAVDEVVAAIRRMDQEARSQGKWSTFNVAFLDPEGLEIHWETVEKLARMNRMDLIINFSTSGIIRNLHQDTVIDRYFGNHMWKKTVTSTDPLQRRRQFINTYRDQLKPFRYYTNVDEDLGYHDIAMRNSKNAEVYSLVFASKHKVGDDFWQKVNAEVKRLRSGSNLLL